MSARLPAIEIETAASPTHAVIWLHGLGADGSDFVPIVPYLGLPASPAIRFVFPHAPAIPVTCNNGYVMPAWYDITFIDGINRGVDEAGIRRSADAIRALIADQNARGIPCANIVLAGFSQGAAMAYSVGLTHPEKLAGIIALSGYIPAPALLEEPLLAANQQTPIFSGHGLEDDVVPLALGQQARDLLLARGYRLEARDYPISHSVSEPEIADIGRWLTARFAAPQG
jgi:phospholipase/carboxylesterase